MRLLEKEPENKRSIPGRYTVGNFIKIKTKNKL